MSGVSRLLAAAAAGVLAGELIRKWAVTDKEQATTNDGVVPLVERLSVNLDRLVVLVGELNRDLRTEPQGLRRNYTVNVARDNHSERLALDECMSRQRFQVGQFSVGQSDTRPSRMDQLSHDSSPSSVGSTPILGEPVPSDGALRASSGGTNPSGADKKAWVPWGTGEDVSAAIVDGYHWHRSIIQRLLADFNKS